MSPATIAGILTILFGLVMAADPKSFGFKNAAMGCGVAGAGFFLALFGFYGATQGGNRGGSGRKVRDHSV